MANLVLLVLLCVQVMMQEALSHTGWYTS